MSYSRLYLILADLSRINLSQTISQFFREHNFNLSSTRNWINPIDLKARFQGRLAKNYTPPRVDLASMAASRSLDDVHESSTLSSMSSNLPNLEQTPSALAVSKAQSMLKAFKGLEPCKAWAEAKHGDTLRDLSEAAADLDRLSRESVQPSRLEEAALSVQKGVETLLDQTTDGLRQLQNEASMLLVSESLTDLGYRLERIAGATRASKGSTTLWAKLDDDSRLHMDMSGISDLSCTEEMHRIEEAFNKKGLETRIVAHDPHNKPQGGLLTQEMNQFSQKQAIPASAKRNRAVKRSLNRQVARLKQRSHL